MTEDETRKLVDLNESLMQDRGRMRAREEEIRRLLGLEGSESEDKQQIAARECADRRRMGDAAVGGDGLGDGEAVPDCALVVLRGDGEEMLHVKACGEVVVTGVPSDRDRVQISRAAAEACGAKPFPNDEAVGRVLEVLHARRHEAPSEELARAVLEAALAEPKA